MRIAIMGAGNVGLRDVLDRTGDPAWRRAEFRFRLHEKGRNAMTIEYIRYTLKDHSSEAFLSAYAEAAESLQASPECLGYDLTRCEEDETCFTLRIHWASTQAHLEGFRKGPNFPPFLAAIRAFMPEIQEMRHYEPTAVAWTRPG